jgi:hypothetical protein
MWLPNSENTARQLKAALIQWARVILPDPPPGPDATNSFPASLDSLLEGIVSYLPPERLKKARPAVHGHEDEEFTAYGGTPHVHVRVPARHRERYRATIRVRVSRPGWLTTSWLAGLVIAVVLLRGRLNLPVLFSTSRGAVGEAGTAATLLLALLAVFATMLVSPGGHPLASRLLLVTRSLILVDSAAVLYGVGSLLLHNSQQPPPATLWSALAWVSGIVAVLLTFSRLLPIGPRRKDLQARRILTRIKDASDNIVARVRARKISEPSPQLDQGALNIPAADGYHYGDDHPWSPGHQARLVNDLRNAGEFRD